MKKTRRILALLLAAMLTVSAAGCGQRGAAVRACIRIGTRTGRSAGGAGVYLSGRFRPV